ARGAYHYEGLRQPPSWFWPAGTAVILISLAVFAAAQSFHGRKAALFFVGWFVILLVPVLPLAYHLSEYYLTLPTIGVAMLGGWGVVAAWRSRAVWKIAAGALLLVYLSPLPVIRDLVRSRYTLSKQIESLVLGAVEARRLHPDQIILLNGVSDEL